MSKAAINMDAETALCNTNLVSVGYISRSNMARSSGSPMFRTVFCGTSIQFTGAAASIYIPTTVDPFLNICTRLFHSLYIYQNIKISNILTHIQFLFVNKNVLNFFKEHSLEIHRFTTYFQESSLAWLEGRLVSELEVLFTHVLGM